MPKKEGTILIEDDESRMAKIAIRIPPFWPEEPELWFTQLEGQFTLCGVTDDESRYAHVLSKIEPAQAREIKDVITRPPATDKYKALKKVLIQRLTDSQEQRIRKLLEQEELGDRKPSQFMRHLITLAGASVPGELIRTLWLGRLPPQMQAILATRMEDRLEEVAEQADRIHEISSRAMVAATTPKTTVMQQPSTSQTAAEVQLMMLSKQVAALTMQMAKLTEDWSKERARNRTRSRSRSRPRFRPRSTTPKKDGICYYQKIWSGSQEMYTPMYVCGKQPGQSLNAANDNSPQVSRLHATDRTTGVRYLVDTGSDVSVYPPQGLRQRRKKAEEYQLYAANGTIIPTYGTITLQPDLGLRRAFPWRFIMADVLQPIIGADFLAHYASGYEKEEADRRKDGINRARS